MSVSDHHIANLRMRLAEALKDIEEATCHAELLDARARHQDLAQQLRALQVYPR